MKRHCIVHVHAISHPAVDLLMQNLSKDIGMFDGERIATVTDDDPMYFGAIQARLQALGFTVLPMANNAGRETGGFFERSLPLLISRAQRGLVFFAHSKGTSHAPDSPAFGPIQTWITTMWRHNVEEFFARMQPNITRYAAFGTLRKKRERVASVMPQEYHYSGTFYWLRLDRLIQNRWDETYVAAQAEIDQQRNPDHYRRYFAEAFPAGMVPLADSFSVIDVEGNPYKQSFWDSFKEP